MKVKKILTVALSCVLALFCVNFFGACGGSEGGKIRVWSTYNTRKVMQSFGEYEDLGAKMDVLMAKGANSKFRIYAAQTAIFSPRRI